MSHETITRKDSFGTYYELHKRDNTPIVFIHGVGLDHGIWEYQIYSKNSKLIFFKSKLPLGFKIFKFRSLAEIPPMQSSKTSKDCWSPPFESCFFFQNKNSSTEMLSIY